jgi:hypothetical protein
VVLPTHDTDLEAISGLEVCANYPVPTLEL